MATVVVTDSGSDLSLAEAQRAGIERVPIWIVFDDGRYRDGVDIDRAAFFKRIDAGAMPKTDPPSPAEYRDVFAKIAGAGNELVCITLSSQISKSFENASEAAKEFGGKVAVVDSKGASGQQTLLALYAVELSKGGATAAEIARKIDPRLLKAVTFFSVVDLGALSRGGRLPKAVTSLGSMLNVSLVLKINEAGAIAAAGQAFSHDKTLDLMLDSAVRAAGHSPKARVTFVHANAAETVEKLRKQFETKLGAKPAYESVFEISLTLAAHIGKGGIGVSLIVP
jgi:DegV family protein with EDD domain